MKEGSNKSICFICEREFSFGPHQYDGKHNKYYDIMVCEWCSMGNHDGWNPYHEEKLINHLEEFGIDIPEKNSKGLLPYLS